MASLKLGRNVVAVGKDTSLARQALVKLSCQLDQKGDEDDLTNPEADLQEK